MVSAVAWRGHILHLRFELRRSSLSLVAHDTCLWHTLGRFGLQIYHTSYPLAIRFTAIASLRPFTDSGTLRIEQNFSWAQSPATRYQLGLLLVVGCGYLHLQTKNKTNLTALSCSFKVLIFPLAAISYTYPASNSTFLFLHPIDNSASSFYSASLPASSTSSFLISAGSTALSLLLSYLLRGW